MDYLIIGGGPAGVSAAAVLRRESQQDNVRILSNEKHPPYAKMVLPYLLAGVVDEKDLYLSVPEGMKLELGEEVTHIIPAEHSVKSASGKQWHYDRLLIAPGGVPDKPEIEGNNLPFVFTVRNLPDIIGMKPFIRKRTGRAVIAGAGPVSMETGDALHHQGMQVTFIVSSNRLFSTMMDAPSAAFLEEKLAGSVDIIKGDDIVRIEENGVVHLKSGRTIECDIVVFGKGVKPCTSLVAGTGIEVKGGIVTDGHMRTSVPDIFAAGDAVVTNDLATGEPRVNALWPEAVEQGKIAALNMAGLTALYKGSLARNILRVFGVSILVAGMGKTDGPQVEVMQGPDFYRKLVLDDGVLKGLISVGEVHHEGLHSELIKRGLDMKQFLPSLLRGTFSYPRFQRHAMKM